MIISQAARLWLYIAMAILPIWLDFFKMSTDFSLRGMAMPVIASVNAAVIVALAKTSPPPDTAKTITTETKTPDGTTEKVVESETAKAQPAKP